MGGKMSLNKGKRGEREIVKALQPIVDKVYTDYPQLGAPPNLQRNTLQSDRGGFDLVGLDWLAPEVKFQETMALNSWWAQTARQANSKQTPVLFYRRSRVAWRVQLKMFLPLGDRRFFCRADVSLDDFLLYFEHRLRQELDGEARLTKS